MRQKENITFHFLSFSLSPFSEFNYFTVMRAFYFHPSNSIGLRLNVLASGQVLCHSSPKKKYSQNSCTPKMVFPQLLYLKKDWLNITFLVHDVFKPEARFTFLLISYLIFFFPDHRRNLYILINILWFWLFCVCCALHKVSTYVAYFFIY